MNPGELGVMAKAFLNRKEDVVQALIKDLDQCETMAAGCGNVLDSWGKVEGNPENLAKQLRTAVKSVKALSAMNRRLVMLLMVYVCGDQFSSDSARLMIKLGRGKEALQDLFEQKLRGG